MNSAISVNLQAEAFQAQTHHNRECRTPLRNDLVSRPLQLESFFARQFVIFV